MSVSVHVLGLLSSDGSQMSIAASEGVIMFQGKPGSATLSDPGPNIVHDSYTFPGSSVAGWS